MSGTQREMTLDEWVDRLPTCHLAHKELTTLRQQLAAAASRLAANHRFEDAPCPICNYNGEGYYQPDKHPCAAMYHAANEKRNHKVTQREIDAAAMNAAIPDLAAVAKGDTRKESSK